MITTVAELDRVRNECRAMVRRRALTSAGAAVVPLPAVDLVADVGLLSNMLPAISKAFQLDHASVQKLDATTAAKVLGIAAGLGNNLIGRTVSRKLVTALVRRIGARLASASLARFVPFVGPAVSASISFGAMKLAGDAHIEDCYRTAKALIDRG